MLRIMMGIVALLLSTSSMAEYRSWMKLDNGVELFIDTSQTVTRATKSGAYYTLILVRTVEPGNEVEDASMFVFHNDCKARAGNVFTVTLQTNEPVPAPFVFGQRILISTIAEFICRSANADNRSVFEKEFEKGFIRGFNETFWRTLLDKMNK